MSLSSDITEIIEETRDLNFQSHRLGISTNTTATATATRSQPKDSKMAYSGEKISVTQRMISACSGSLITSLVVTPFDVIRIRIQQQGILPQGDQCCQNVFAQNSPSSSISSLSSARSSLSSSTPELFWVHNNYCNPGTENCMRITSTFQGFATVSKHEGVRTLWRGLSLTLLMAIPSNIIYFTGYEYIRDHSPFGNYSFNPLLCGALARCMSATFVAPAELIKTKLQSIPADSRNSSKVMHHLLKDSFSLVKRDGIATLFKGLGITLCRDVPFSGIYWSSYEFFKSKFANMLNADFNNTETGGSDDWKVFATSFLSGSISGVIAAFFTNPFDVGKTRLQITMDDDLGKIAHRKTNMFKSLANIYKQEGIGALYAGFGPRVMKIAPACAIMISSYEVGKKFFKNGNARE
ncbi:MTM1 [Candida oxycetoniae]|uniref:Mitochondrial thiamine pyrophosphate carrier 1 n=1 Tax=Candida oxycetoniae TaxID=497107 RepID=A0AAI9T148_9ASCO|nr:MTM1 [Candida oxycetoniae]KAI3406419.2 MTM1 [Candida oxycetoniae]